MEGGVQPGQEPGNTSVDTPISKFFDLRTESLEALARAPAGSVSRDIDDILKQVIEDEMNKAVTEVRQLFSCTSSSLKHTNFSGAYVLSLHLKSVRVRVSEVTYCNSILIFPPLPPPISHQDGIF